MIDVEPIIHEVGHDACQTAMQLAVEMARIGVTRFRATHEHCDGNALLLNVARRHGLTFDDLSDDDYYLATRVVELADWICGDDLPSRRGR